MQNRRPFRTPRNEGRATVLGAAILAVLIVAGLAFFVLRAPSETVSRPNSTRQEVAEESTAVDATESASVVASEPVAPVTPESSVVSENVEPGAPRLVITGVVSDPQGPVSGAVVRWLPTSANLLSEVRHDSRFLSAEDDPLLSERLAGLRGSSRAVRTEADGSYRLEVTDVAQVGSVVAAHPTHATVIQDVGAPAPTPHEDVEEIPGPTVGVAQGAPDEGAQALAKRLGEGGEARVTLNFELQPAAQVTGRVLDAQSGRPVAGMKVLANVDEPGDSQFRFRITGSTQGPTSVSGDDGVYRIQGLLPGEYRVTVRTGESEHVPSRGGGSRKLLLLPNETVDGVDLTAELAGVIEGRVMDTLGAPLPGVKVMAIASDFMQALMKGELDLGALMNESPPVTEEDGSFRLRGLPLEKSYELNSSAQGFAIYSKAGIELTQANRVAYVEVVMSKGSAVSGFVRHTTGEPAAGEWVSIMPDLSRTWAGSARMFMGGPGQDRVQAEFDGRFRFENLSAGKYRLSTGDSQNLFSRDSDKLKTVEVDGIADVIDVELVFEPAAAQSKDPVEGAIRGEVVDDLGQPVGGAQVRGNSATMMSFAHTQADEAGRFTLEVEKGDEFEITAEAEGFSPGNATARIGDAGLRVVVSRLAQVRGRVLLPDGALPGVAFKILARRSVDSMGANPYRRMMNSDPGTWSDGAPDGTFSLTGVRPGAVRLEARVPGYATSESPEFEVAPGASVDGVEFRVSRGGAIFGRVELNNGQPVSGARVTVIADDGDEVAASMRRLMPMAGGEAEMTDADGHYEITRMTPGTYTITASHPEYASSNTESFTVGDDEQVNVKPLRLSRGATIRGVVRFGEETKAGVMIQLIGIDQPVQMANTDAEGSYRITGVRIGEYAIQVMDLGSAGSTGGTPMRIRSLLVETEGDVEFDLDFRAGRAISGKIAGVPGMTVVIVRRPDGLAPEDMDPMDLRSQIEFAKSQAGMTMISEDGEYRVEGVEPGEYLLEVPRMSMNPGGETNADRKPYFRKSIRVGDKDLEVDIEIPR